MKLFLLISTLLFSETVKPDTIQNWQIYYGNELILTGNENGIQSVDKVEIKITDEREIKNIDVVFNYDNGLPTKRTFELWLDSTRRKLSAKVGPGNSYVICLQCHVDKYFNRQQFEIFYSDNKENRSRRLLGTIVLLKGK